MVSEGDAHYLFPLSVVPVLLGRLSMLSCVEHSLGTYDTYQSFGSL